MRWAEPDASKGGAGAGRRRRAGSGRAGRPQDGSTPRVGFPTGNPGGVPGRAQRRVLAAPPPRTRGMDISDAVCLLGHLFLGARVPSPAGTAPSSTRPTRRSSRRTATGRSTSQTRSTSSPSSSSGGHLRSSDGTACRSRDAPRSAPERWGSRSRRRLKEPPLSGQMEGTVRHRPVREVPT